MNLFDFIYHGAAIFILLLGAFVFINNFRNRASWAFSFWALNASAWMLTLYWGFWFSEQSNWTATLITFRWAFATSVLMLALMTVFFYFFPTKSVKVPKWIRLVYAALTVFLFVSSLTPLIHHSLVIENGVYVADRLGPIYSWYNYFIVLNFFAALYLATKKYLLARGIEKRKIAFSTGGYFIFVFFAILTNVVLPSFGIFILLLQKIVPILTLFFIVPAFLSIQKYRFFNFSYASLNLLRTLFLYFLFVSSTIYSITWLDRLFIGIDPILTTTISVLLALFIYNWAKKKIPVVLVGSHKEFKEVLEEAKTKLTFVENYTNLQQLIESSFITKLRFISAQIYIVRKKQDGIAIPTYKPNKFTAELTKYKKDLLVRGEIKYMKIEEKLKKFLIKKMDELEVDVCLPLFSENNLIGFFVLRQKEEDETYSREILAEVMSVKRPLEITVMNLLLKMNLEEENNLMKSIIDKKTRQLKNRIEQINELLKQQSDFIAVTAHEFRTPLSIATFQLDDVLTSKKSTKETMKDLRLIETSLTSLKKLTEKLFAVQQYDLNKVELHPEKINITNFVKQVFKDFKPIMKDKKLDFSLDIGSKKELHSVVDQAQLRQVLHNLLTNASKFTPKDEKVTLALKGSRGNVEITVADSGAGIPNKLKKTIFDKFRTKSAGAGIGLGLYLCKKIIELHKGKLWVEDAPKGGAAFKLQLKLAS